MCVSGLAHAPKYFSLSMYLYMNIDICMKSSGILWHYIMKGFCKGNVCVCVIHCIWLNDDNSYLLKCSVEAPLPKHAADMCVHLYNVYTSVNWMCYMHTHKHVECEYHLDPNSFRTFDLWFVVWFFGGSAEITFSNKEYVTQNYTLKWNFFGISFFLQLKTSFNVYIPPRPPPHKKTSWHFMQNVWLYASNSQRS